MSLSIRTATISVLVSLALGGWLGCQFAAGRCAQSQLADAQRALQDAGQSIDTLRQQLHADTARIAGVAQKSAQTLSRQLAEANHYETLIARAARADCERDPDAYRVLVNAVTRANLPAAAPRMPDPVSLAPRAALPAGIRLDAMGAADRAVGRAMPQPQPGVSRRADGVME